MNKPPTPAIVIDKPLRRIRQWMDVPGRFQPGERNAISDVPGVQVGHCTLIEGDSIRTGVTIVRPHAGDPFLLRCPAAVEVGNGFGKLIGAPQVEELGELESLIGLTNTLSIAPVLQGLLDQALQTLPRGVFSVNILVGETNDGLLNDIRGCHVRPEHVQAALAACSADVQAGAVGAGTGTVAFGYKGGIGSASRRIPGELIGEPETFTLGALVQSNYGGNLSIYNHLLPLKALTPLGGRRPHPAQPSENKGSCMILIATDAPLDARQLKRLARRGILALARTGSFLGHSSGDFAIAFSNHAPNLRPYDHTQQRSFAVLSDEQLSAFFEAALEAVQEALYDSLTLSPTMLGHAGRRIEGFNPAAFADILPLKRREWRDESGEPSETGDPKRDP